ncbi:uncharacterized protein [Typha angustifolia]|uniref:uncharacterized protein isoform X1 n=1 Tax=Typha angustifolia TaxID=59011 RepID=UPI003C2CC1BA
MIQGRVSKGKADPDGKADVVFLSSSDDEEANGDLSLAIVERAMRREAKRKRAEDAVSGAAVVNVSSSSSDEVELDTCEMPADPGGDPQDGERSNKRKKLKKRKKKKKQQRVPENEIVAFFQPEKGAAGAEEEPSGTAESPITEVKELSDNVVLRKLLRGPRYFDPGESNWATCFNCGEGGHVAVNCTMEKRRKPCFVCGLFGHNAKQCMQGQDCFICKRRGHIAKDCPDKHKKISQDSRICLRCGDGGHDMASCINDYSPEDLKEIQCYICKKHGHLCCSDFTDSCPTEVSCYNCAQSGHTGSGCAKPRGETSNVASPTLCYKCGEEGHFARGCTKATKYDRLIGESSTPIWKSAKKNRDWSGFRSVSHDFGKRDKKKSLAYDERWNMSASKSRIKGGWIVDDSGDLPAKKFKSNGWVSPKSPIKRNHGKQYLGSGGNYSSSQSLKKHKAVLASSISKSPKSANKSGSSASRFSNSHIRFGQR